MKIKKSNGDEIEIKLKRRHTKKLMKQYGQMTDNDGNVGSALDSYNEQLDEIALEVTDLSEDEFDDLDAEDANLILNKIQELTIGQLDFLKSSLK